MRKLAFDLVPVGKWPIEDQAAWTRAITGSGLFGIHGPLAHQTPEAIERLARAYGRWLGFLTYRLSGTEFPSGLPLAESPALLTDFVSELDAVAPNSARNYFTDLLTACRGLLPSVDFELLHRVVRHSWRTARPITDKMSRIVPAYDVFQLGLALMTEAASLSTLLQRAAQYRGGLMIAMLISAPARITSFVGMRIGKQLIHDDTRYRLCFDPNEVKTRRYLEYALPIELNERICTWLEKYRPECLSQQGRWHRHHDGDSFWISCDGAPFSRASTVRERLKRVTEERLGRRLNPHIFRDIAATSIVSEIPDDVGIVKDVMGHASLESGMKFYNQAQTIGAARSYQTILAGFRRSELDEKAA